MENTTRISDLPDSSPQYSAAIPPAIETRQQNAANVPTNYAPINLHPNPYGISAQNPIAPTQPQSSNMQQQQGFVQPPPPPQQLSAEHQEQLQNMQRQRLPSRDIPRETLEYAQDEEIQANYIPKKPAGKDYVRDYEDMTERNLREYEEKKRSEKSMDNFATQMQIPVLIALLYFFFQLPIVNTLLFKRFSFLSIYDTDGNFNFYGLLLKSTCFGGLYYMIQYMTAFISEI